MNKPDWAKGRRYAAPEWVAFFARESRQAERRLGRNTCAAQAACLGPAQVAALLTDAPEAAQVEALMERAEVLAARSTRLVSAWDIY